MPIRPGRSATQQLTRIGLVLSPRRDRRRRLAWSVLVVVALSVGAASFYWRQAPADLPQPAGAQGDPQLQQQLEQARLMLRLSEARSQELERQIDALNQRLRESQEELTFFRKAREGK